MMMKQQGWEVRFDALVVQYYYLPFVWGVNDCFIFAHDVVRELTGVDIIAPYRGMYADAFEAQELIEEYAAGKYETSFADLTPVENISFAQRGDVGIITIDGVEYCGAISMNGRAFLLRNIDGGLRALPLKSFKDSIRLWRAL